MLVMIAKYLLVGGITAYLFAILVKEGITTKDAIIITLFWPLIYIVFIVTFICGVYQGIRGSLK